MGNPKQKWTSEEEEALKAGIAKHGTGKWKDIQRDPEFHPFLSSRSNIDLKDKWRNMSISAGIQGSRDKSKTSKAKANNDAQTPASIQLSTAQPAGATPAAIVHNLTAVPAVDDSSKGLSDGKTAPVYNALIFEALSNPNEPGGLETSQIVSFIEQRLQVPPNFRKLLSSRLRRLVAQDKIEKVQNYYKMKSNTSSETKTLVVKKDSQLKQLENVGQKKVVDPIEAAASVVDPIEEAASVASSRIAEAENKAFELAETVKEQERISKLIEENETMLQLARMLFEKCSNGETVQIR